ncbi:uncharacterized protein LOC131254269 [Magnolia sinica]|uniref:uncharacterized protein LOC131254269 n=1 Tax=Magnolia sinica TaxID=86752 RepID=UPI002657CFEF|nr:uncharacterized protein LOC131254269 [Magnolia sinica]
MVNRLKIGRGRGEAVNTLGGHGDAFHLDPGVDGEGVMDELPGCNKVLTVNNLCKRKIILPNLLVTEEDILSFVQLNGTCKRILKELHSYEKEVEKETTKTADMKEKGADPYDLKQQENMLAESRMMVPDCHTHLEASLADLTGLLEELKESNQQGPEIEEAQSIIAEVKALFQSTEGYLFDVYEPKLGDPARSYAATHSILALLWDSPLSAADFKLATGCM